MLLSMISNSVIEFGKNAVYDESDNQVLHLARKSMEPLFNEAVKKSPAYLIAATTCPDSIAPSLGQKLCEKFPEVLSTAHVIDMVQGCAGGVNALILGTRLALQTHESVLVIASDAARKSVSKKNDNIDTFGNGAAAHLIQNQNSGDIKFLHSKSRHYPELTDVVTIKLGHDSQKVFNQGPQFLEDPREHLGLKMDDDLALKLLKKTESFYNEFLEESEKPDVMVFHQVNPRIISLLKKFFMNKGIEFYDYSSISGNCGAASVGIVLDREKENVTSKKVFLCGFGTGGIITAGLWQF